MKSKLLFITLFCISFIGCSNNDEDNIPSYIGCWHTIAQENNGKWDTDMHHISNGSIALRMDGRYYNSVQPWTKEVWFGNYQVFGDSLVFYDFKTPDVPAFSCRMLSLSENEAIMRYSRFDMKNTYKIKFEKTKDNFDFDFIRNQLENPDIHYPNQ